MNKTLYLDMDGVVVDFQAGAAQVLGYRLDDPSAFYPEEDWKKLSACEHWFADLPKMAGADILVEIARCFREDLNYRVLFLTAIPHNNDIPWAFHDKIKWAEKYYPDIPVHFGPYSDDKQHHCKPHDILVDDRRDNCEQWTTAGGIAIHVLDVHQAIYQLEDMLEHKLSLKRLSQLK